MSRSKYKNRDIFKLMLESDYPKDQCLLWPRGVDGKGYGIFTIGRQMYMCHRISFQLHIGRTLAKTEYACHRCDTPRCFNPYHLFLGDKRSNVQDCAAKGRLRDNKGSLHGNAKLNEDQVRQIKALYKGHFKRPYQWEIAAMFGVKQGVISDIFTGKDWRHVD